MPSSGYFPAGLFPPGLFPGDYFPGASGGSTAPPTTGGGYYPAGLFPTGLFPGDYFPGAGTAPTPVVTPTPVGTGATIVGAIMDVFSNDPDLASLFEGRVSFNKAFTSKAASNTPWAEVYQTKSDSRAFSGRRYLQYAEFKIVVWDEDRDEDDEPAETRMAGEAVRDAFDFCLLAFDDGVLRQFRRVGDPVMRDPQGRSRGDEKLFQYILTYHAVVARALPAGTIAR
jgi:hypothetical protein